MQSYPNRNNDSNGAVFPIFSSIHYVQEHWARFFFLGLLLIILGIIAVGAATATSFVTILFIGVTLVIGGVAELVYAFWARQWSGFFFALLSGLLYGVVGLLVIAKPIAALAALTLLIGALFVVTGIFKIVAAFSHRTDHWGWIAFSGVVSLVLGGLVLSEWPATSLWVIGLFVGIDLIIYGWVCALLALGARRLNKV